MIEFILLLIGSYLLGTIPMAYLVVKWRYGVDIRHYGSGVVGAANVFRNFSRPLAAVVFLFDVGKGCLIVWIAQKMGLDTTHQFAAGIATIIGHNWPVFMRFNSGRGLATTIGVAFFLFPWGLWVFIAGAVFTLILGSSPLPVLVGLAFLPAAAWIHHEPMPLVLGLTALLLLLIIRRLTAPRTAASDTVSTPELLLNRFLFDRDTRDSKALIALNPITIKKLKENKKN